MTSDPNDPPAKDRRARAPGGTTPPNPARREFAAQAAALGAAAIVAPLLANARNLSVAAPESSPPRNIKMAIVCIIRYQIDPFQRDEFKEYAKNWGRIIPRCGGRLIGYFLPWQGTNDIGWGLIAFDNLAAYEKYQARLREDPDGIANLKFAQEKRCILREERNFVEVVDGTLDIPAAAT